MSHVPLILCVEHDCIQTRNEKVMQPKHIVLRPEEEDAVLEVECRSATYGAL